MSARLEQLEQKVAQFEAKDVELTELVNEGKAGTLKLEEALAALTQQVEKSLPGLQRLPPRNLLSQQQAPLRGRSTIPSPAGKRFTALQTVRAFGG